MSSPIPSPPTPPFNAKTRDISYGIWAWASVVVFLASIGWASVPGQDLPVALVVASVVLNGFGSITGFLAKNNVDLPEG